jgi:hypothetical protein
LGSSIQPGQALLARLDFLLREFLHFRVGQQGLRFGDVAQRALVILVQRHQRPQFGVLARHLAVAVHIGRGAFGHQQFVQFVESVCQLVQLGQH